jgi:hypothetical protein
MIKNNQSIMGKREDFTRQFRDTNYFIGMDGSVYRKKRDNTLKELKVNIISGHPSVTLYFGGNRKGCLVNRLVAECFIKEFKEDWYVSHRDNNKKNNNLINLKVEEHPKKDFYYKLFTDDENFEIYHTCKELAKLLGYKQRASITSILKKGFTVEGKKLEKYIINNN